jgi:hypothetical protein
MEKKVISEYNGFGMVTMNPYPFTRVPNKIISSWLFYYFLHVGMTISKDIIP